MLLANPLANHLSHAGCTEPSAEHRSPLARLGTAILREIRIRRSLRHLDALDDAMLHDLGVTRGGFEDVVRHGRTRDHRPVAQQRGPCRDFPVESLARPVEWR